jgi:hypothetical protein
MLGGVLPTDKLLSFTAKEFCLLDFLLFIFSNDRFEIFIILKLRK